MTDPTINVASLAVAGTSQATATPIVTPSPAFIYAGTSGGDGTAGVRLPKAVKGKVYHVKNAYNGNMRVYPASGDAINAIAPDTQIVMAALTSATFIALNSTTWYTIPLLPS
jgi:hypothetical protein